MNVCNTCKYWTDYFAEETFAEGISIWGHCSKLEKSNCFQGIKYDEGEADEYLSREDFGCILHEEK